MKLDMSPAQIADAFRTLGLDPIERGIDAIRDLMLPNTEPNGRGGVLYQTVITNGTGRTVNRKDRNAELESNSN